MLPRSKRSQSRRHLGGKSAPTILRKSIRLDGVIGESAPFTSETRALRRNATSGCSCSAPHAQGTETEPIVDSPRGNVRDEAQLWKDKALQSFFKGHLMIDELGQSLSLSLCPSFIGCNLIYHACVFDNLIYDTICARARALISAFICYLSFIK